MRCSYCKEEIEDGSTVCPLCESPLQSLAPALNRSTGGNQPEESASATVPQKSFIPQYAVHTVGMSLLLVMGHYEVFRFIPLFLIIFYVPFLSGLGYVCYVKFIRGSVEATSAQLARYFLYSGLITMLVYQIFFYHSIAKSAGRAIISTAAGGLPVPFLGSVINYGARGRDIADAGAGVMLTLNAIPALELLAVLLLLYFGIRFSRTAYELHQQGKADPFAKAAGLVSTVNLGLSQLTLGMRGKGDFDGDSIQDAELREKLQQYPSVSPQEQCVACDYSGPMGVIRTHVPWYLSWWLLIPLACTGVGLFWVAIAVALRFWKQRLIVECPLCGVSFESQKN